MGSFNKKKIMKKRKKCQKVINVLKISVLFSQFSRWIVKYYVLIQNFFWFALISGVFQELKLAIKFRQPSPIVSIIQILD